MAELKSGEKRSVRVDAVPRATGQLTAEPPDQAPAVGTTIVGGQPPRRRMMQVSVPAGVERALFLAAIDGEFREELLRERDRAAARRGLRLSPSEQAMLRVAPAEQLQSTIDSIDTSPRSVQRRRFMQAVAVGVAALAAGQGCGDDDVKADVPQVYNDAGVTTDIPVGMDAGGIQPDMPRDVSVTTDVPQTWPDAGITTDVATDLPPVQDGEPPQGDGA